MTDQTFPIEFSNASWIYTLIGLGPAVSHIHITGEVVEIRMGWAFRCTVARISITEAVGDHSRVWGWGVHGWKGRWLVNGSSRNIVRLTISPAARASVCLVPVNLRELRVSVTNPEAFLDQIESARA